MREKLRGVTCKVSTLKINFVSRLLFCLERLVVGRLLDASLTKLKQAYLRTLANSRNFLKALLLTVFGQNDFMYHIDKCCKQA